jgi:hypothetical protein
MRFRTLILFLLVALCLLCFSCKDDSEPDNPAQSQWITVPQYDFPIFVARRGGVVTTSLETFDVTGFLAVGDSTAFNDSLEWKVLPYNRTKANHAKQELVTEQRTGMHP